ncbi:unnamed protein product [Agarophyton chilense]
MRKPLLWVKVACWLAWVSLPEQYRPATNKDKTLCSVLAKAIKGKGGGALTLFRERFGANASEYLEERPTSRRALLEALRKELMGIPKEGDYNDLLWGIQDGTYSISVAGKDGGTGQAPGGSSGSKRQKDTDEEDESGDEYSDRSEAEEAPKTLKEPESLGAILLVISAVQKGQAKMLKKQGALEGEIKRLKGKQRSCGRDLAKDLDRALAEGGFDGPDFGGSSSGSEPEADTDVATSENKKINKKFFEKFAARPFPEQSLQVDLLLGENMLRKALTNYPTVSAWVEAQRLTNLRSKREAASLAKIVDCIIGSFGIMRARRELAVEVALRRLAAVIMAENSGNWDAARELEEDDNELVPEKYRRRLHKSAKLRRELAGRSRKDKSAPGGGETN